MKETIVGPTTHNTNRSDDNNIDDKRRRFSYEMVHLDNAIVVLLLLLYVH